MMTMTRGSGGSPPRPCLLLAFEMGHRSWKLGFGVGMGPRPRVRQVAAGAVATVLTEVGAAKMRFGLAADAPVISGYEAGRDGFWWPSCLLAHGMTNHVVDSSSMEGNRRARRHDVAPYVPDVSGPTAGW